MWRLFCLYFEYKTLVEFCNSFLGFSQITLLRSYFVIQLPDNLGTVKSVPVTLWHWN